MVLHKKVFYIIFIICFILCLSLASRSNARFIDDPNSPYFIFRYEIDSNQQHYTDPYWIDKVKQYMEEAWDYQVNTLRFRRPRGTCPSGTSPPGSCSPETPPSNKMEVHIYERPSADEPGEAYWGSPPAIDIDNSYFTPEPSENLEKVLKNICAHEFFHCIQMSYCDTNQIYYDHDLDWVMEGTAVWIEDEIYDDDDFYLRFMDTNYSLADFLGDLDSPLDRRNGDFESYCSVLFWKYLSEQKGQGIIKNVFTHFYDGNNMHILKSIGQALGDPGPDYFGNEFKTLFRNYTIACYANLDIIGFQEPGIRELVEIHANSFSPVRRYYVASFDTSTGQVSYRERTSNHLSSDLLIFSSPFTETRPTDFYLKIDCNASDINWEFWLVQDFNNDQKRVEEITIDPETLTGNITLHNLGTEGDSSINKVALITSRMSESQDSSTYKYIVIVSNPPYLKALTADHGGETKYHKEWVDNRDDPDRPRTLRTNYYEPFSTSPQDVYISLLFSEEISNPFMNVAGRSVSLSADSDTNRVWTGVLSLAGFPRNQPLSLEVAAQDAAGNNLDGSPHTPASFNFQENRWDHYEDANDMDTHIGGIDDTHVFQIATQVQITVRDPNGNEIFDGGRTFYQNNTIEVEVDEEADIVRLEVISGDLHSGNVVFSDNNPYDRRHTYQVTNLPEGSISIRALDNLGGEAFHRFQIGRPSTPIESSQERIFLSNRGIWGYEGREGMGVTPIRITPEGQIVVEQTIPLGGQPADVVVRPDGQRVYVANVHGYISVLEFDPNLVPSGDIYHTSPYRLIHTIQMQDFWPFYLAITPDGSRLYTCDQIGRMKVFSTMYLTKPSLNPIDTDLVPPHTEMDSINILSGVGGPIDGHFIEDLAMSPDGTCLYVLVKRSPPDARLVDWEHEKRTYVAIIDTELITNPTITGRKIWRGPANRSLHSVLDYFEIFGYYAGGMAYELNEPVEIGVFPDGDYIYVLGAGTNCGGHAYARHLMDYRAGVVIIDPQPLSNDLRLTGYSMGQAIPGSKFFMTREIIPGIQSFYEATRPMATPSIPVLLSPSLQSGATPFNAGFDPFIAAGVSPYSYEAYEPAAINDARSIAIRPDGERLWVSFLGTSNYSFMNVENPLIPGPYEAATMAMETVEQGNFFPYKVAYSYDGRYIFGTNRYGAGPTHWQGKSLFVISDEQVDLDMKDVRYFYLDRDLNDYEEELIMSWEGTQVVSDPNGNTIGYWSRLYPGHTPLPSTSLGTIQSEQIAGPECIGVMAQVDSDYDGISDLVEVKNRYNQEVYNEDQVPYTLNFPLSRLTLEQLSPIKPYPNDLSMAIGNPYGGVNEPDQPDPSPGKLINGILLPTEGVGYRHHFGQDNYNTDNAGTLRLIKLIEEIGREWIRRHPEGPRMIVDDLSRPGGGQFLEYIDSGPQRHTSHQNGLDVDIWYFRGDKLEKPFDFVLSNGSGSRRDNRIENLSDYDPNLSTELINLFLDDNRVRSVWVDPRVEERASELNIPLSAHASEKLVIRGTIDGSDNGSRRDMDSYFHVSLELTPNVDLDIEGVLDNIEDTVGGFVVVNNDDDNESEIPDNEEPIIVPGENDLVKITIQSLGPYTGSDVGVFLDKTEGAEKIDVWISPEKVNWLRFNGTDNFFAANDLPKDLWVEGVSPSESERDVELTLSYEGNKDWIRFTVQPRHVFALAIMADDGVMAPPGLIQKDGTITFRAVVTPVLPGTYHWRITDPLNAVSIVGPQDQPTITLKGIGPSGSVNDVSIRVIFRPSDSDQRQEAFHSLSVVDLIIKAEDGVSPPPAYILLGKTTKFKAAPKPNLFGDYSWTKTDPGNRIQIKEGTETSQKVSIKGLIESDPFNDVSIEAEFVPTGAGFHLTESHIFSVLGVELEPELILLPDPEIDPNYNVVDLHVYLYNADETIADVTFHPLTEFEVTIEQGISREDLDTLTDDIGLLKKLAEEFVMDEIDTNIIADVEINPSSGQLIAHTTGINLIRASHNSKKTNRSLVIVGLNLDAIQLTPRPLIDLGITPFVEQLIGPMIGQILNESEESTLLLTNSHAEYSCLIHLFPSDIALIASLAEEAVHSTGKLVGATGYLLAEATFSVEGWQFDTMIVSSIDKPSVTYLKNAFDMPLSTFLDFESGDEAVAKSIRTMELLQSQLESVCGDTCERIIGGAGDLTGAIRDRVTHLGLDPNTGLIVSVGPGFTKVTGTLDLSEIPGINFSIGMESNEVLVIVGPELTEIELEPNKMKLHQGESAPIKPYGTFIQTGTIDGEETTLKWEWPIPDYLANFHPKNMDDTSIPGFSGIDLRPQVATVSGFIFSSLIEDPDQNLFEGEVVDANSVGVSDIFYQTCIPFLTSDDEDGFEEATCVVSVDCNISVKAFANPNIICSGEDVQLMAMPIGGTGPYTYRWIADPEPEEEFDFKEPNPNVIQERKSVYTIKVVDVTGCSANESVEVKIRTLLPGSILINEVVIDPEQDWSSTGFESVPGVGGTIDENDQWIEIYNAFDCSIDLTGWTVTMTDETPSVHVIGTGLGVEFFSPGSSLENFLSGGYLVIGNPEGDMSSHVFIELRNSSDILINDVEIGDDPELDGDGDGAPNGLATGIMDEAITRFPNGVYTDVDSDDFQKRAATIGYDNSI